tara:strand:- start:10035 stop:10544 length:510 start_codon:yes stop_codon:yes gene_type:complete
MAIITGKAYFAKLDVAENPFGDRKKYSINILLEDAKTLGAMKKEGFHVKDKDKYHPAPYMPIYTYEKTTDGRPLHKPRIFDTQKNIINNSISSSIGNDSIVNVSYKKFDYDVGGNKGSRPILKDVQIVKLVDRGLSEEFEKQDDGYVAPIPADEEAVLIEEQEELPFSA